jgi:hypothetical protein
MGKMSQSLLSPSSRRRLVITRFVVPTWETELGGPARAPLPTSSGSRPRCCVRLARACRRPTCSREDRGRSRQSLPPLLQRAAQSRRRSQVLSLASLAASMKRTSLRIYTGLIGLRKGTVKIPCCAGYRYLVVRSSACRRNASDRVSAANLLDVRDSPIRDWLGAHSIEQNVPRHAPMRPAVDLLQGNLPSRRALSRGEPGKRLRAPAAGPACSLADRDGRDEASAARPGPPLVLNS